MTTAACGVLLFFARGSKTETEAMRSWGIGMVWSSMGLSAISVGGTTNVLAIGLGYAMLTMGRAVSWNGARRFNGRPARRWAAVAGPALWIMTVPFQTTLWWMWLATILSTVYTLATAVEFQRGGKDQRLPSYLSLLVILYAHAGVFAARAVYALTGWNIDDWAPVLLRVIIIEGLVHALALTNLLLSLVKERAEARSVLRLRGLTLIDSLTGIGNRRHFDEQLDLEWRRARRQSQPLALLLIDVDCFKAFNDTYGHQRGDECLRQIAQGIERRLNRPGDLLARYGGEEFGVLLPNTDQTGAELMAEALRLAVRELRLASPMGDGVVTISVGVGVMRPGEAMATAADLLRYADRRLYRAKDLGRDRVCAAMDDEGSWAGYPEPRPGDSLRLPPPAPPPGLPSVPAPASAQPGSAQAA